MKKIICLLFLFIFSLVFISCDENNPVIDDPVIDDIYYEVKFVIDTKEEVIKVKENTKVTKPDDPEKVGYEFIGWFNDDTLYDFESLVTKDITIEAVWVDINELTPSYIEITNYENMIVLGYTMDLDIKTKPSDKPFEVKWTVDNDKLATIDENGVLTALKCGIVKVKAESIYNSDISHTISINIYEDNYTKANINLGGYEIIIMNADSALADNDPFLDGYKNADKLYKQQAWKKIEEVYNCKIRVESYPMEAPWGAPRIAWIKDNASLNQSKCDIAIVSSNWIPELAPTNSLVDVTKYYEKYGNEQMMTIQKEATTYNNGLYGVSEGIKMDRTYVDLGLYYNVAMLEKFNIKDPATLFNEGRWNYTDFTNWVIESQSKLPVGFYILGGAPYYYLYGLTNASGVKLADNVLMQTNVNNKRVKDACELINNLHDLGCTDNIISWAESDGGFIEGITLMTTGYLWFVNLLSKWDPEMFDRYRSSLYDYTSYGYVPFPYPDDVKKEDTRYGLSGLSVMVYVSGRVYPDGVNFEDIYRVVNELFLLTNSLQNNDPEYDSRAIKTQSISKKITHQPSVEALLYMDYSKAFYEPSTMIYYSPPASNLKGFANKLMYSNEDFDEMYQNYGKLFENDFNEFFNINKGL